MVNWLSIVETDKVIHTVETGIVKLVVEIEIFGMSSDEFDKETGSSDGLFEPVKAKDGMIVGLEFRLFTTATFSTVCLYVYAAKDNQLQLLGIDVSTAWTYKLVLFEYVYTARVIKFQLLALIDIRQRRILGSQLSTVIGQHINMEMITSQLQGKLWLYDEVRT
ncbi:hypothetical protein Tco_0339871 [Tanacetum coccineum]